MTHDWLAEIHWDAQGLAPAIVQDAASGKVLMFAWMNRAALEETLQRDERVKSVYQLFLT